MSKTPFRTPNDALIVTPGDLIRGADDTIAGAVILRGGNSTSGNNVGGTLTVQGGAGFGTGAGGILNLFAGDPAGTGAGANVAIAASDSAGVSAVGGVVALSGGSSTGTAAAGSITLTPGVAAGSGDDGIVIIGNSTGLQFTETATIPGPAIVATQGRVWLRNDGPNVLMFTDGAGTNWVLNSAAGASTLQQAYVAGNDIATDSTNGGFDVSGTEVVSLDSAVSSNFTVSGTSAGQLLLTLACGNAGTGAGRIALSATDDVVVAGHVMRGGDADERFQILGGTQAAVTGDSTGPSVYLKAQDGGSIEGASVTVSNGVVGNGAFNARGGNGLSGGTGSNASIVGGAGEGTGDGGFVSVVAGTAGNSGGGNSGGIAYISGGLPTGVGNGDGGGIVLTARNGRGTGTAGPITLDAGNSGTGATGDGGDIGLTAGNATSTNGSGGDINLNAGTLTGSGSLGAVRANAPVVLPSYTVVGVPAASGLTGGMIFVTNETGGAVPAFSDGTNWRRVTDRAIVS